ncbi:hypothetical protein [Streptomyces erythrochromogenes]|uniref:hypothetical protein n=1 Tax=Streptomyces erythrochromogenes TaxID=285574 RepID=UPI002256B93B|nr:hypothetical protein [Streptomyces erythrochromogenes]MCX5584264.1 hypothetical protein [Streptomyces erythrochromogenes]
MLALILLFAIAYCCAKAIDNALGEVGDKHKKRVAKAGKKTGRKLGAKLAAYTATAATFGQTFGKGFIRGWKREWPKARKKAAARFDKNTPAELGDDIAADGAPNTEAAAPETTEPAAAPAAKPTLVLIKTTDQTDTTGDDPMAIATIPEVTGVNTLKAAVARFSSEANITAEEASALAQRASDQLAAIEATIEQASALEFGDDGGTLEELSALRDQYAAALNMAQRYQQVAVDSAAIASQSSRNIHHRHGSIQEAIAAQGGRMAAKEAYTNDV